jgi:poly(A) polymerase Pap1
MHITRGSFFDKLLYKLKNKAGVTEINPIQDAQVPIIKMKFDEVEIDLL